MSLLVLFHQWLKDMLEWSEFNFNHGCVMFCFACIVNYLFIHITMYMFRHLQKSEVVNYGVVIA